MKDNETLIQEQIDQLNEDAKIVVDAVVDAIKRMTPVVVELCNTMIDAWNQLLLTSANGKIKHLALHAKKKRTRKKNFHRLQKQFMGLLLQGNSKSNT